MKEPMKVIIVVWISMLIIVSGIFCLNYLSSVFYQKSNWTCVKEVNQSKSMWDFLNIWGMSPRGICENVHNGNVVDDDCVFKVCLFEGLNCIGTVCEQTRDVK